MDGIVIAAIIGVGYTALAFAWRHDPEPPNPRWKLPLLVVLTAICVVLAVIASLFWAVLAVVGAVQIGFVLAGRNPWWMQSVWEKWRAQSTSAPRSQSR